MAKVEQTVVKAIRDAKSEPDSLVALSNGIVLRAQRVPNMIFMDVTRRFTAPKIPVIHNDDLGRDEENPNDPAYQESMSKFQADVSSSVIDTMMLLGTELVTVPKGLDGPDGTTWMRKLKVLGFDPGDDDMLRYLMWVKYYACVKDEDITAVIEAVGRLSGVSEEDVAEAVDQFRSVS